MHTRRSVVIIGNFDGVHRGHQRLISLARQRAEQLADQRGSLPVLAVTFWPHPMSVVSPDRAPKLLSDLPDRVELLQQAGVDEVRVVQFNREVAGWQPEYFIDTILRPLNPALVVVGENFRFGRGASGSILTLREAGREDFDVQAAELLSVDEQVTSSSVIRQALIAGDVEAAAENMGRNFRVRGIVVVGDQRGRHLGFPTANLPVSSDFAVPADGVYAGWLTRLDEPDAERLPAAISVGTNPTFAGVERRVETYVLDRVDLRLYGVEIAVEFVKQLRGQMKFDSVEALIEQMTADVASTRAVLEVAPQRAKR